MNVVLERANIIKVVHFIDVIIAKLYNEAYRCHVLSASCFGGGTTLQPTDTHLSHTITE